MALRRCHMFPLLTNTHPLLFSDAGFANPLPFRVAVAIEDTSSSSMTYVLLKLDADMPGKKCVAREFHPLLFLARPASPRAPPDPTARY